MEIEINSDSRLYDYFGEINGQRTAGFFLCVAVAVHFAASMHLYVGMYIHARSRVICVSIQT